MDNRAFTLIELLVVIGIIGILSSAAFLRYPVEINRVKDARVLTEMSQFRMQAGILAQATEMFDDVNACNVAGICVCSDPGLDVLCKDIQKNTDEPLILNVNNDKKGFCFISHLQGEAVYFCVDGKLRAKKYAVSPALAGGACEPGCKAVNACSCE